MSSKKSKKLFIAQSASESENEISENDEMILKREKKNSTSNSASKSNNSNAIFDSSEEDEDEEMTKEDLEFLRNESDSGSSGSDSGDEEGEEESEESPDELSDDDLELIEENLGKRRTSAATATHKRRDEKFKRLRRRNEVESSSSDSESEKVEKTKKGSKNDLQNLFNDQEASESESESEIDDDLNDFIEDDEEAEDELPGTIEEAVKYNQRAAKSSGIPRRRAIIDEVAAPKRVLSSALASGQISKQAWDEMMEIFGDGTDYLDLVIESDEELDEEQERELEVEKRGSLNHEIDTINSVAASNIRDIPERLNELEIKIIEDSSAGDFDDFIQKESVFIAKKLQKLCRVDSFSGLSSAILSILRFIHQHGLEVPFIATYRKEYFSNFFGINEIWAILDEDLKYRQVAQLKSKIKEKLGAESELLLDSIENEWNEAQLQFINEFLIRQRNNQKTSSSAKTAALLNFAHKIVPSAANFVENLKNRRIVRGPLILSEVEMENEAVEIVARSHVSSVDAAISSAVGVLAEEFGNNPQLFSEVSNLLMSQATITVTPTALGTIEISSDPTHYLAPLQYITEKNVSTFIEDQGLALARGVEAKLITVEIGYGSNFDGIMRELEQFLPGIERFKREVFSSAWKDHWMPRLNRLILQRLRSEAENWIVHFSQFYFQEKLMVYPLNLSCDHLEDDQVAAVSINFVNEILHFVELDKFGRVLRQESLKIKQNVRAEAVFRKSLSGRVPFIIVAGEGQDCLELYRDLKESREYERNSIVWACDDSAQIFKNSIRAAREFPECLTELKYAIAVGRRMLNPVAEFVVMSDDELLQLSLHPLQNHLPRDLRLKHLHRALVNVVNLLSVPINELLLPGLRQGMLTYVSGLGPQKAAQLAKKLGSKLLQSRADLITQYEMGRRTFTNAAGFIKITPERTMRNKKKSSFSTSQLLEPLDGTRIHPESYDLARKMSADALELDDPTTMKRRQDIFGDEGEEDEESARDQSILAGAIIQIMKEPKKLDDLLLLDYAKEIEKLTNLPKITTLEEIKSELQGPRPDPRLKMIADVNQLTPINQVVRMLTGKDENWWYPGRPVTVKLLNPPTRKLASLIDANGLLVGVHDEVPRNARPGAPMNAFLERIDLNRLIIDVDLKRPANFNELILQNVDYDPFYNFQRKNNNSSNNNSLSTPKSSDHQIHQKGPLVTRQLSHPAFKNLSREDSENYLALAPVGEVLIRPSSQKRSSNDEIPGDLTLTWKVGPGLYSHVPLGELERPTGQEWNLGRILLLPALIPGPDGKMKLDRFEDFDEIVGRRIEPVLSLLQEAQACPKYFSNPGSDAINLHLKDQIALNPGRIPYCITLATEPHCGHLFLSHPGGNRRELIRVDPRGFALTDPKTKETKIFERIEKLVDYFKRHYKHFSEKEDAAVAASKDKEKEMEKIVPRDDPRTKYQQFA